MKTTITENKLITWITVLSTSMKLWAMSCRDTQDRWVMVESIEEMWSGGEGNGKPLQYSCLEKPMNSVKRQKDMTLKDVDVTGDGSKVHYYKQQYCIGTWNGRSMNQGKLEVVKQEMARVNINFLGISELKWIPDELLQILKDDAIKVQHSIC